MMRLFLLLILVAPLSAQPTNQFIIASYNVENWNYIQRAGKPNQPKPADEKAALIGVIAAVRPDVLAMQEMGNSNDLAEVTELLRAKGLVYDHSEWIRGMDPERHVCLLSRFPITERHSRTDYAYLVDNKPARISRGILDVRIQVNDHYAFRALVVHLKSKRPSNFADQALMRLGEAQLLRAHIGKILKEVPDTNLIAMGDFNDTPDSEPLHAVIGLPPFQLFALRPVDSAGKDGTHYWRARREFSRIDYLILSPGMSNEYIAGSARIADVPGWEKASDHRMLYASFLAHDVAPTDTAAGVRAFLGLILVLAVIVLLVAVLHLLRRRQPPR